ncbi:MAG TPA: ABC transporter ATP-binding protein [Candidatus Faecaligallichristensenella faecipullorum]|nr:ABC transporter ATP-binding protein [Candidatus Faecaligallichristensenella faecipullorum]
MKSRRMMRSMEFMRGSMARYMGAILAVVVSVVVGFVTPLLLAETIDAVIGDTRELRLPGFIGEWVDAMGGREYLVHNMWLIAVALIGLNVINGACQYLRGRWTAQASESIAKTIRDRLYRHLQTLNYDYHVKAETGDLIQRCTSDVETIRRFLSGQLVAVFRSVLMVGVALVIMLRMNRALTGMSMILVPLLFLFASLFFRFVMKFFKDADEAEGKMSAVLQENLTGVRVVRAFGRQKYEVEKFTGVNDHLRKQQRKVSDLLAVYWSASDLISMLQQCITLITGVFMAARGEITVGDLTVFVSYISMLLWPIRELGRILADMGKSFVSLDRIDQILCQPPEKDEPGAIDAPIDRDIEFRHVGFEYESKNPVLRDVSFTVKRGQTVAILGATGSGKSTLMLLLQRLYDVKRGEILIGGVNIRNIRKAHLRAHIGLVLQEPFLYSRSVKDNVGIARRAVQEEEIFEATRTASAHDFILEFEKGYDTLVGERGVTLSGGQKQRIAIARTLLKENDILIFDDSLSAVDTETDAAIREALKERKQGVTTFIVSHRLTTLAEADFIVVLDKGKVAQMGPHSQLIHEEGLYRRIYQIQSALEQELNREAG